MNFADPFVRSVVLSAFEENAYVVSAPGRDDCVVVDPGMEPEPLIALVRNLKLRPRALLVTHGHFDHIGGIDDFRDAWFDVPIFVGEKDAWKLTDARGNLSASFGVPRTVAPADRLLKDGEAFEVAGLAFQTLETPGHARGHVVYLLETSPERSPIVFCGDLIFCGSVGRSDFPDSDGLDELLRSIREKILTLPDSAVLYPGHGSNTTVGDEKKYNQFLYQVRR